jgi:hypothetical protein
MAEAQRKIAEALEKSGSSPALDELKKRLAPAGPSVPVVPPSQFPRTPPPPDPVAPRLHVTANDSDVAEIPAGWPLVLAVSLHAPVGATLRLAAPSGPWSSLVRLELPQGAWNLRPASAPDSGITLDGAHSGLLLWTLLPEELDALPRGNYQVKALLDTPANSTGAWAGTVQAASAELRLVKPIPRLTEEQDFRRSRLLVNAFVLRSDPETAGREAEGLLRRHPNSPLASLLVADLLESAGKKEEAAALLDRAIEAVNRLKPGPRNFLRDLVRRRDDLAAQIETKK